jgi:hypothetical protein
MGSGHQEARYTHHFVGTNRDRPHARWNVCSQAGAGSRRRQLPFQNWFALGQRIEHDSPRYVLDLGEPSGEG